MFDPVIAFFTRIFEAVGRWIGRLVAAILWPFKAMGRWYTRRGWIVRGIVGLIVLIWLGSYIYYFWQTQHWANFNPNYIASYNLSEREVAPGSPVPGKDNTCATSAIVDVTAGLIDFNVNQNSWIPSLFLSKLGFFGMAWKYTPFFDNKAAFQLGINEVVRRTAQELVDRLGRVRGTSQIDQNLQDARQNVYYNEDFWYFSLSPFGLKSPTWTSYRQAIKNFHQFNERLARCDANYDPRADNLLRFFEQMASMLGSTSDILDGQMAASNAGWFDPRADDRFWFAFGELYALKGIMTAAASDFSTIFRERGLTKNWQKMDKNLDDALKIQPWIISNGGEAAFIMPSHLATMGFRLLTVRTNLTEMRDILDR